MKMNTIQKNDIIRAILLMPPIDRIEILDKVYENFNIDSANDFEDLWAEESEQRIDGYLNGSISTNTAEDVFTKVNGMQCNILFIS